MDSESDNESEDYSYAKSSDEIEYSSDLGEEFTASFEKNIYYKEKLEKRKFQSSFV